MVLSRVQSLASLWKALKPTLVRLFHFEIQAPFFVLWREHLLWFSFPASRGIPTLRPDASPDAPLVCHENPLAAQVHMHSVAFLVFIQKLCTPLSSSRSWEGISGILERFQFCLFLYSVDLLSLCSLHLTSWNDHDPAPAAWDGAPRVQFSAPE